MKDHSEMTSNRSWAKKFYCAFRGMKVGIRGEGSFFVHLFAGAAVIVAAMALSVSLVEWCILLGCIASVMTTEMLNTSIERLARAVDEKHNPKLRDALDIGGAAVLISALFAAAIGVIILGSHLRETMAW